MSNQPKAGDGIVDLDGFHWIVNGIATDSTTGAFIGVFYTNEIGDRVMLRPHQYRRETFGEYLTRPTGFGRTSWMSFTIVQAACAIMIVVGANTWSDGGWVGVAMAGAIEAVLVGMSYRSYTGKTR